DSEVEIPSIFDSAVHSDPLEITPVDIGAGEQVAIARPMFNGRTGAMKQALMSIYGGTPETQEAVARGLEWLKRNQRRDGSWSMLGPYKDGGSTENKTAATAMALLAFLGDGHTHLKGKYSKEVERGIRYLVNKQERNGFFARDARGHQKMYAQAQASIVVCELYAMTKDSWLRPKAQLAIDFAITSQSSEGGWRYEPGFDSDTSVTGWFVMALQSGRAGGLEVDPVTFDKVSLYLDSAASDGGATYGYQPNRRPDSAMTAEGILCRQYIGWSHDNPLMFQGIRALLDQSPFDINDRDVYYWYYATQIMHHFGGSPWREWNEVMREQLPRAQVTSGREDGSWSPRGDRWGGNAGRLYTTCLSIYCLEVYYRHLPLYKAEKQQ
ncbi:MAG: terpene cyclase/mutase family protein, partial [Pirellulales bacterium]|nr:terpene cyclase/mutase family protein [Pirellulales bacterium]